MEHYTSQVLEEDHYYPFGLTLSSVAMTGAPDQPLKYNSKELQSEFGLEYYDYGARMYNSQIGRWNGVDPMAESNYYESPICYAGNNPVKNIDLEGKLKLSYDRAQLQQLGVTDAQIHQFSTIVENAGNLLSNNAQALQALSNTTGLSESQIMSDFQPGNGPTVYLTPTLGEANGGKNGINIDPNVITYLSNIDPSNKRAYNEQLLGIGLTLLHEYAHYGDQITNGGNNTGQFTLQASRNSTGGMTYKNVPDATSFGNGNMIEGRQPYKISPTGHRGTDVEAIGYGIDGAIDRNGKITNTRISNYPITTNTQNLPAIPLKLPEEVTGNKVRKLLESQ